jgi:hypothetical protein
MQLDLYVMALVSLSCLKIDVAGLVLYGALLLRPPGVQHCIRLFE